MKLRKLAAIGLAAAMMTGMLAGCGSSGSSDEASGSDGGTETAKDVTIWYYWETEGHQVALDKVIEDYNNSQDTYEVTAKYVPFADFKKQLSIGASGYSDPGFTGPCFLCDNGHLRRTDRKV